MSDSLDLRMTEQPEDPLVHGLVEAIKARLSSLGVSNYTLTMDILPGDVAILFKTTGKRPKAMALSISREALVHTSTSNSLDGVGIVKTGYNQVRTGTPKNVCTVVDAFISQLYIRGGEVIGFNDYV